MTFDRYNDYDYYDDDDDVETYDWDQDDEDWYDYEERVHRQERRIRDYPYYVPYEKW